MPLLTGQTGLISDGLGSLLLACGAGLLIFLTIVRMRKRYAQGGAEPLSAKERLEGIRRRAAAHDQTGSAMAEVEELTRRCAAHLDNKAERLEYLLELAEGRIAELEQLLGQQANQAGATQQPPAPQADAPDPTAQTPAAADNYSFPQPPEATFGSDKDATDSAEAPARRDAAPPPPPAQAGRATDPLTRQIYELADEGQTPVEIARRLDEQVGKVELILALRAG
jgi:hypothetical protein